MNMENKLAVIKNKLADIQKPAPKKTRLSIHNEQPRKMSISIHI